MRPPIDVAIRSPLKPNKSWPKNAVVIRVPKPIAPRVSVSASLCFRQPIVNAKMLTGKMTTIISRWKTFSLSVVMFRIGNAVSTIGSAKQWRMQMPESTTAMVSKRSLLLANSFITRRFIAQMI